MPWSSIGWERLGDAQYQAGHLADARVSYAKAISKDSRNWQLWLDLALANTGTARHDDATRALALNPLSPEIACIAPSLNLTLTSKGGC